MCCIPITTEELKENSDLIRNTLGQTNKETGRVTSVEDRE